MTLGSSGMKPMELNSDLNIRIYAVDLNLAPI